MKEIHIVKGQILQRPGDVDTKVYSVKSGLLRSYSINEKGIESIYMFAPEGWLIADNNPADAPSDLFIDALENSTITANDKNMAAKLDGPKLIRRMAVLQKRIIMLLSSPAIDRYKHFVETYPQIVQRVPQRMIASYLGITPEALSRAKRELLIKG